MLAVLTGHSGVIRPAHILLIITHALRQHADAVGDNDYHCVMSNVTNHPPFPPLSPPPKYTNTHL